ncbi:MAG: bifunctional phosphopantothenoylcysteine decarboxylase/phosphopantothenate--cysteine ligase CoaBC [Actinobacteria bacterium]|nr:bifunctional phosphopantothenoylcysteine decarboxylase/phosphopantothenate--cysteine ligase CoaBC [Actinomycetota bacterium]
MFKGKTIALGVSGGIAAYKAVDLASELTQAGATVKIIMSENAVKFVSPITFQSITCQPVITDLFASNPQGRIYHISISEEADVIVIAPATANILAKAACGIADDTLSTTIVATRSAVVMIPAMNNYMWLNKATQHNLETLRERGIHIIEPEVGRLACGEEEAIGRFPKTETIIDYLKNLLTVVRGLEGKTILVTAGGTHEPIDPVRFIGNRSSGKMGYAIAEAAEARGGDVVLISGPTCLRPPYGIKVVNVETARQMKQAVLDYLPQADAVIMAAAIADFRPSEESVEKIKKEKMPKSLGLGLNPDILQMVSEKEGRRIVVGFAAESENIIESAVEKLKKKNLDLIVANNIGKPGVGFGSDLNLAILIDRSGPMGDLKTYRKSDLAGRIMDWLVGALKRDAAD